MASIKTSEIRQLRCELTETELQKKAERVAELLQDLEDTDAELRSAKSRFKSRLESLEGEKSRALHDFRTRSEVRDVRCELQLDYETRRATWVRTDTGEPLAERPLSDEERTPPLFPDGGGAESGEAGDGPGPDPDAGLRPSSAKRRAGATAGATAL